MSFAWVFVLLFLSSLLFFLCSIPIIIFKQSGTKTIVLCKKKNEKKKVPAFARELKTSRWWWWWGKLGAVVIKLNVDMNEYNLKTRQQERANWAKRYNVEKPKGKRYNMIIRHCNDTDSSLPHVHHGERREGSKWRGVTASSHRFPISSLEWQQIVKK
jgi:hypothetical protein